jgi:choline dehydrogenase-like flavoprotein
LVAPVLIDARSVDDGALISCDLCVVGSGPAGLSLVERLADSGLSICVLESGGTSPQLRTQRLYRGRTFGHAYFPLHGCRFRLLGGSSNRWGRWCHPLEPIDFEPRAWVPDSGWPIGVEELDNYAKDSATVFGLPDHSFDPGEDCYQSAPPPDFAGSDFRPTLFRYSTRTNFAEGYRQRTGARGNIRTFLHANVTRIDLVPGSDRVRGVSVRTLTGRSFEVEAGTVVLATGGIENARLLLASNTERSPGLGNEHDLVGRYFMEHLHLSAGHVLPATEAVNWDFFLRRDTAGAEQRGALIPSADAQRRLALLGTSISIEAPSYDTENYFLKIPPEVIFPVVRSFLRARNGPAGLAAEGIRQALRHTLDRLLALAAAGKAEAARRNASVAPSVQPRTIYIRAEQAPAPANRVVLGRRRDELGIPLVDLHWRLSELDTASIAGWLELLDTTLRARGLGGATMPSHDWRDRVTGGPHHMGTTRMSDDPKHGVVDSNCRVHSVKNLYVAGSSVFPTGGYANPTFTIVALALRLGDHLREQTIRRSSAASISSSS